MRRLQALQSLLLRFHADERGAFFVLFGVLAIVLVATAGAVVDYTTIEQARARAQDALDSAALGLQRDIYDNGVTAETLKVKAQDLLEERLNDANVTADVTGVTIDKPAGKLQLTASLTIPTAFVALVGVPEVKASVISEATRGSVNLEVSVALDTTGSMSGQKIQDLRDATNELIDIIVQDVQTPTYTKLALVPYSQAVNVGSYADQVRGTLTGPKSISGASWAVGSAVNISGITWKSGSSLGISTITRANPARVTTSSNHGLSTGDTVYISGVSGMSQVNNKAYVITKVSNTQFSLNGVNSSSYGSYRSSSGDSAQKCLAAGCPLVVTTNTSHGFSTGDYVALKGVASPLGSLNTTSTSTAWQITRLSTTTFTLNGAFGPDYGTYNSASDNATRCQVAGCEVVVTTSSAHELASGDRLKITSVRGMTQINNSTSCGWFSCTYEHWIANTIVSSTKFSLQGSVGPSYGTYSSGGSMQCWMPGCLEYWFINANGNERVYEGTTCVTERTVNAYTDAAPSTTPLGPNYRASGDPCIAQSILPLSTDKAKLHALANALTASGSTGGHIGLAWAWYMVSPNFAYLWPEESRPAPYPDDPSDNLLKVVILMTDGAFNTVYYNGVVAKDSISGSGGSDTHINANAPNGSSLDQGAAICSAIKAGDQVVVYTVGFDIGNDTGAINLMTNCASDPSKAYLAATGTELKDAFKEIAQDIAALRVTK